MKNSHPNRKNFKLLLNSLHENSLVGRRLSEFMFFRILRMCYEIALCYYFTQQDYVQSVYSHVPEFLVNLNDHMPHIFNFMFISNFMFIKRHFNCPLSIYSPQLYNMKFAINRQNSTFNFFIARTLQFSVMQ